MANLLASSTRGRTRRLPWSSRRSARTEHQDRSPASRGILEAIALGRAVGRMPLKLRLIGIEPEDLGWGEGLTAAVAHSIDAAADLVLDYLGLSASASAFRSSR